MKSLAEFAAAKPFEMLGLVTKGEQRIHIPREFIQNAINKNITLPWDGPNGLIKITGVTYAPESNQVVLLIFGELNKPGGLNLAGLPLPLPLPARAALALVDVPLSMTFVLKVYADMQWDAKENAAYARYDRMQFASVNMGDGVSSFVARGAMTLVGDYIYPSAKAGVHSVASAVVRNAPKVTSAPETRAAVADRVSRWTPGFIKRGAHFVGRKAAGASNVVSRQASNVGGVVSDAAGSVGDAVSGVAGDTLKAVKTIVANAINAFLIQKPIFTASDNNIAGLVAGGLVNNIEIVDGELYMVLSLRKNKHIKYAWYAAGVCMIYTVLEFGTSLPMLFP